MNWEMISAVGQMLGAIGVIISIIYLAVQIRNQNKESQRAAMNVLTTHWSDLNRTLVENPDLAALWIRALQSFDELDGASKLRGFGAHLGVSCEWRTVSISASWMERSISGHGADMSGHSPIPSHIQDAKPGGLHENTGTPTNSAR
jgi:hypothetical protein